MPTELKKLVGNLSPDELTTPYLKDEWTVAQNIHHLVDSHMNSYIRCKLIATEDYPTLKPYNQEAWAVLPDASTAEIEASLILLAALHQRWTAFWNNLPETAWERTGTHPETGTVSLADQLAYYAWHGEAHLDQIRRTLAAGGIEK